MAKGDTFESDLLKLIFNGTSITGLAQNHSSPATSLYVGLHTGDPGEAGTQLTNEATYGTYARQGLSRVGATAWAVSGTPPAATVVKPVADITFPECTSLTNDNVITYFSVGTLASGAGYLLYSGAVTPSITMANGVAPRIKNTSTIQED